MSTNDSDTWTLPPWMAASSTTGPHPTLIPVRDPRRPRTLSVVPEVPSTTSTAAMGRTKRGSPPPDLMRVASSFALLGALLVALILSWALDG